MEIKDYQTFGITEHAYQFFSEGPKGRIEMRVQFSAWDIEMYNLTFGVWNLNTQEIGDLFETRNGDMDRILATVAQVSFEFLATRPKATIMASGSTPSRTRKYQMGIAQHIQTIAKRYQIFGFVAERDGQGGIVGNYPSWQGQWSKFKKGINYDAFLMYLK